MTLVVAFVLGIIASVVAWFLTAGLLTPKIEIRATIEQTIFSDGTVKYRFALMNKRLFRTAQDVEVRVRCGCRISATSNVSSSGRPIRTTFGMQVDDEWIPLVRSRWYRYRRRVEGTDARSIWPQYPVLLTKVLPSWLPEGIPKDSTGGLDVCNMLGPPFRGTIRLVVIAHDSWSGTRKVFIRRFDQSSIICHALSDGAKDEDFIGPTPGYL